MPELTVGAGLARGLLRLAVSKGARQSDLASRSGIDPGTLEDNDNRVPFANYVALMHAAKALCNDPALALHYGETRDLSEISIVGLVANASETMVDALMQLNRYGRLVIEFDGPRDRFQMVRKGTGLWLVDTRENPNEFPELTESTFAGLVCGPRQFGVTQLTKEVHVTHGDPGYRTEYDRIFRVPTVFDCAENAMLIDEAWMFHPVALQPRYVFGIFSEHADALMKELESATTIRGRVESLLMPILHKGEISMDAIAEKMAVSRQTLFRRLKGEGTTYEKVLDELRHRMSVGYLQGKKVSVNETAYLVGFSEPAAFSRAFKRWTGMTPREVRASTNGNGELRPR